MVRWTDRPAMTIAVDLGRKAKTQTNKTNKLTNFSSYRPGTELGTCADTCDVKLAPPWGKAGGTPVGM